MGFSILNHPAIGVPPFMETCSPVGGLLTPATSTATAAAALGDGRCRRRTGAGGRRFSLGLGGINQESWKWRFSHGFTIKNYPLVN